MSKKEKQLEELRELFKTDTITRQQIAEAVEKGDLGDWPNSVLNDPLIRVSRGVYNISGNRKVSQVLSVTETTINHSPVLETNFKHDVYVPQKDPLYYKWGHYKDIEKIIQSKLFCTIFITGLSGNGKTMMVEQACANADRELIRLNLTIETDEDDLFGGFRLISGESKWFDGPVVKAMESGAVLLLDEVDLASTRIMALQPVLEGKPLVLKKVGRVIYPKEGFNIIATANTKGQGDTDGKFVGTNVLNEAFLERFSLTFEQPYPSRSQEEKILSKLFSELSISDDEYLNQLLDFVKYTRDAYSNGSVNDIITTRRLTKIVTAFSIFGDKNKALELCLNRFDDLTKQAFIEFYKKLEEPAPEPTPETEATQTNSEEEEVFDATIGVLTF